MTAPDRTPGMTLKLERVAADIAVKDVAARMGISPSRVSRIEDDAGLRDRMVIRYRQALEMCRTSRTSAEATA